MSNHIQFPFSPDKFLNGIVTHLKSVSGNSIIKEIFLKGGGTKLRLIYNVLRFDEPKQCWWDNFNGDLGYCSSKDAWFLIEIRNYKISMTAYTIGSPAQTPSFHQPKSWKIEVSENGESFTTVHQVTNCNEMNVPHAIRSFLLPEPTKPIRFVRYILFENHSTRQESIYELSLSAFELFGTLYQNN